MAVTSVQPYWDLTFDADGDPDPRQRDALLARAREHSDLVVFSHGWNNDLSTASALYDRFYAPFPGLLAAAGPGAGVRIGYVGVHWPSMRFCDEPIPDFPHTAALTARGGGTDLDPDAATLKRVLPGHDAAVDRIAELLARQPDDPAALEEFGRLVRTLTGAGPGAAALASDVAGEDALPRLLTAKPADVCDELADALGRTVSEAGEGEALLGGLGKKVWAGARELLRQGTYFAMKGRAGTVGRKGLGPFVGQLAERAPDTKVHLVGHSFGARLVSFALAGLPEQAHNVASVTLLQGAFSHSAYSPGGALDGMQRRVGGPVLACHSSHDTALGILYPLASRLSGDDRSLLGDDRWGALGHDGFHGLPHAPATALTAALGARFSPGECLSVDASAVVRRGGPPAGAHSDICHPELARLILRAAALLR